jgi:peptidoglycan hydrolase-like protein with peptidoglycan-binding domain/outer membrane protein OmpA-like peptidoglycan-associated protein
MAVSKAGRKGRESRKGTGDKRSGNGSSKATLGNQATVQLLQDGAGPDSLAIEHGARIGNQAAGAVVAQRKEDDGTALPTLRLGSTGPFVTRLQLALTTTGEQLKQDGQFGARTQRAVKKFQAAHGLEADGIAGAQTWAALTAVPPATTPERDEGVVHGAENPEAEAKAAFYLGRDAYKAGDHATAIRYWRRMYVIPELPDNVRYGATANLALAYEKLGDVPNAVNMNQEAMLFASCEADDRRRHLEALRRLRSGEQPEPGQDIGLAPPEPTPEERAAADEQAKAEIERGVAAVDANDNPTALQHFMAAYRSRHASPELRMKATYLTGRAHQEEGAFPIALEFFQEALAFPTAGPAVRAGVLEFMRQARLGQKATGSGASETMDESEQERVYHEGKALLEGGDYEGALGRFTRVYALKDARTEIRQHLAFNMAIAHQRMQHFGDAISLFEESIQIPGDDSLKAIALERIRQCRNGEVSFQVKGGEGLSQPTPPGQEERLFTADVFFPTGGAELGGSAKRTVDGLVDRMTEHHNSHDGSFRVLAVGRSSSRWGNAGEEAADERNRQLSRQRADSVMAKMSELLPKELVVSIQGDARGDADSEALGLPPSDNSWVERAVGIAVFFTAGAAG